MVRGPKKGDKMCDRIAEKPGLTGGWSLVVDAGVYNMPRLNMVTQPLHHISQAARFVLSAEQKIFCFNQV